VLLLLGLFLEAKLAFWVTLGIPTSFLGAFLFLPAMGISINMISMFAFIIALGIVVDDAIVAGENIYEYRQRGLGLIPAAIRGARDVAMPITFAILTNIVAFLPLMFVGGWIGRTWAVIPLVVGTVFAISWIEALLILPCHLAHTRPARPGPLHARQQAFASLFSRAVERGYRPFLAAALDRRYLTAAVGFTFLAVVVSYALSGRMGLILMPTVESDRASASAVLPLGAPLESAIAVRDRLTAAAGEVAAVEGGARLVRGVSSVIRDNEVEVRIQLTPPGVRPISTGRVSTLWREKTGQIAGVESLRFESDRGGPGRGPGLTVELSHRDTAVLDRAAADLAGVLQEFPQVRDVDDGVAAGKPQLDFRLTPEGRALGLTSSDVARQLRAAFHGIEALKQQRGRNEVTVLVRLPEAERASEYDIEQLLIRTPGGRDVPLAGIATLERRHAYADISRRDGRRTLEVSADVVPQDQVGRILETLNQEVLPRLARDYPGLTTGYEGRQAQLRDALGSLKQGFAAAVVIIFVLLAIPFRSYVQPVVVMLAIPFGVVGAVIGHLIMGYSLSLISMMGIVALAGVVVNDSLVMVDQANRLRAEGAEPGTAIVQAAVRRFRPIFLTTVTTFGGLAPMIFETSRQARFMIPMAISLGYGIVFATAITLVLVPCFYLMVEDAIVLASARHRRRGAVEPEMPANQDLPPPVDQAAE